MNQPVQPYRQPEATPVGHAGTRVEIHERPAWAISGWLGLLVVAACIAGSRPARPKLSSRRSRSRRSWSASHP